MVLYKCDKCGKLFNKKSNFESHKNRKKPCFNEPKNIVKNCEKIVENCEAKVRESANKLKNNWQSCKSNICSYCGKEFRQHYNLLVHLRKNCKIKKQLDSEKENIYIYVIALKQLELCAM